MGKELPQDNINTVLTRLSKRWVNVDVVKPNFTVKELARELGVKSGFESFARRLLNLTEENQIELANKSGKSVNNNNLTDLSIKEAPYKKSVNRADYRSRAPGGGPVIKRRINEKDLNTKLKNYGAGNLKVVTNTEPVISRNNLSNMESSPFQKEIDINAPEKSFGVISLNNPDTVESNIKNYMRRTNYWAERDGQIITPDMFTINQEFLTQEIQNVVDMETKFLVNIIRRYKQDIDSNSSSILTQAIEGPLAGSRSMSTMREWLSNIPENEIINSFRLDLGITKDKSRKPLFVSEITTISCGLADTALYREAQKQSAFDNHLKYVGDGSLIELYNSLNSKNREMVIVGTTPLKPSQELYEKSYSDMANILKSAGCRISFQRLLDLKIKDRKLYSEQLERVVTDILWIGDPFKTSDETELDSQQGKIMLEMYKKNQLTFSPTPCFPLSDNKLLEAIIWDDRFSDIVPDSLRDYVPKTTIITRQNVVTQKILSKKLYWKDFVLKQSITQGGGMGVIIGYETKKDEFEQSLRLAKTKPGNYVLQEFIDSEKLLFRIKRDGKWSNQGFFLRLEPTVKVEENRTSEITDLLFTGRFDTRKVGGSYNCIMGSVFLNK